MLGVFVEVIAMFSNPEAPLAALLEREWVLRARPGFSSARRTGDDSGDLPRIRTAPGAAASFSAASFRPALVDSLCAVPRW